VEATFGEFGRGFAERLDRLDDKLLRGERTRAVLGWLGFASVGVLLALFVFGMLMLATLFAFLLVPVVIVVGAGLPILVCRIGGNRPWAHVAAIALPAVIVPVAGLLGFNVLWGWVGLHRPGPLVGLAIASVVVGGLEYLYLRWVHRHPPDFPERWAGWGAGAGLALFVVTRRIQWPEVEILVDAALVFGAVSAYLRNVTGPDVKRPFWWAVLLVLGFVFTVPLASEAAQRAKVGLPALGGFAVFVAVVIVAARRFARDNPDEQKVLRNHLWPVLAVAVVIVGIAIVAKAKGVSGDVPPGRDLPVAAPAAAVPRAAIDHRPLLMFDSGEVLRTPVDIDDLLRSRLVEHCPEGKGLLVECPTLTSAGDLSTDGGNLRFKTESFGNDTFRSRIYVNVVDGATSTYLDYWWYLPDNPANTARGAMCGAGLVIPEITCFDHQSDWEGVTVVLDKASGQPREIHYAAHKFVVRVPWDVARAAAVRTAPSVGLTASDVADRPLVFVARGTHAAYPQPCRKDFCRTSSFANDNQFDGRNAWPENGCQSCVSPFPRTAGGAPASWNAFTGHWGSALCLTKGLYCARSEAPKAPGAQRGRFLHPWCVTHEVVGTDLRRLRKAASCAASG
jgi:hypothetical protein